MQRSRYQSVDVRVEKNVSRRVCIALDQVLTTESVSVVPLHDSFSEKVRHQSNCGQVCLEFVPNVWSSDVVPGEGSAHSVVLHPDWDVAYPGESGTLHL